jgi:hypothetical protein
MRAIKSARKFIEADPTNPAARILADLVLALESETAFSITELYQLDSDLFALAMELLNDWRIDRYYIGKAKLFDLSWQHRDLRDPESAADDAPAGDESAPS